MCQDLKINCTLSRQRKSVQEVFCSVGLFQAQHRHCHRREQSRCSTVQQLLGTVWVLPWRSLAALTTCSPRRAFYQLNVSHAGTGNPILLTSAALKVFVKSLLHLLQMLMHPYARHCSIIASAVKRGLMISGRALLGFLLLHICSLLFDIPPPAPILTLKSSLAYFHHPPILKLYNIHALLTCCSEGHANRATVGWFIDYHEIAGSVWDKQKQELFLSFWSTAVMSRVSCFSWKSSLSFCSLS